MDFRYIRYAADEGAAVLIARTEFLIYRVSHGIQTPNKAVSLTRSLGAAPPSRRPPCFFSSPGARERSAVIYSRSALLFPESPRHARDHHSVDRDVPRAFV